MSARSATDATGVVGVIGATGLTGRAVLSALTRRGRPVRALSRRPVADADVQWQHCDLTELPSHPEQFAGLQHLYVIPPRLHPAEDTLVIAAFAAAAAAGVEHIVYHSVMHPASSGVPHHQRKTNAEDALRRSSAPWTILQPNSYTQNIFARLRYGDQGLELMSLWPPDGPGLAFVDLADVADVAATVCGEHMHAYATYELAGPDILNGHQLAARLSAAWGEPVRALHVSDRELPAQSTELRHLADHYSYHAHYAEHGFPGSPFVLQTLLGRSPTHVEQVAVRVGRPARQPR